MPTPVDLYDHAYGQYPWDVYAQIRLETYGEDLGQTSWVTLQEANDIPRLLTLTAGSQVLEIGCGSGRYALRLAEQTRCRVLGLDVNPPWAFAMRRIWRVAPTWNRSSVSKSVMPLDRFRLRGNVRRGLFE